MSHLRIERDGHGNLVFNGVFTASDFMRMRLDHFDRALLADCDGPDCSAADKLLALEMLFRRAGEQLAA